MTPPAWMVVQSPGQMEIPHLCRAQLPGAAEPNRADASFSQRPLAGGCGSPPGTQLSTGHWRASPGPRSVQLCRVGWRRDLRPSLHSHRAPGEVPRTPTEGWGGLRHPPTPGTDGLQGGRERLAWGGVGGPAAWTTAFSTTSWVPQAIWVLPFTVEALRPREGPRMDKTPQSLRDKVGTRGRCCGPGG